MLLYSCNGGNFVVTIELISFVKLILDSNKADVVLVDVNSNPIEIVDIPKFYNEILSKYIEATNYYNFEYNKLRKSRTVSAVNDIIIEG